MEIFIILWVILNFFIRLNRQHSSCDHHVACGLVCRSHLFVRRCVIIAEPSIAGCVVRTGRDKCIVLCRLFLLLPSACRFKELSVEAFIGRRQGVHICWSPPLVYNKVNIIYFSWWVGHSFDSNENYEAKGASQCRLCHFCDNILLNSLLCWFFFLSLILIFPMQTRLAESHNLNGFAVSFTRKNKEQLISLSISSQTSPVTTWHMIIYTK